MRGTCRKENNSKTIDAAPNMYTETRAKAESYLRLQATNARNGRRSSIECPGVLMCAYYCGGKRHDDTLLPALSTCAQPKAAPLMLNAVMILHPAASATAISLHCARLMQLKPAGKVHRRTKRSKLS